MSSPKPSAVCPAFFIEARDVSDFVAEFGPYSGRYVFELPRKHWMRCFKRHLDELSPADRLRVVARLEQVGNTLTELPPRLRGDKSLEFEDSLRWKDCALRITGDLKPASVVGHALDPGPFPSWSAALDSIRETPRGGWNIRGGVQDYVESIEPLLRRGPSAYLIDPYFRPLGEGDLVINGVFERVTGSRCYEVHVIARDDEPALMLGKRKLSHGEFEEKVKEIYAGMVPADRQLVFHLVRDLPRDGESLQLHTRYFLTRFGALDFGYGFQLFDAKVPQIPVKVVAKEIHEQLIASYIKGVTMQERRPKSSQYPYPRPGAVFRVRVGGA